MAQRAGAVKIQLSVEAGSYSAALDKAKQQVADLTRSVDRSGHATVSSMQASSAAIRELNGDFSNNIRAVERFITTIPGVGTALQAAFPLVGGIALAGLVVEMGLKVTNFVRQVNEVPTKIRDSFAQMNESAQLSNDSLRLVNDTLSNDIAKLERRPQNELAIAFDESRIAADKLGISIENDYTKTNELLKINKIGLGGELLGKGSTADVSGSITSYMQQFRDVGQQIETASHTGDKAGEAAARARLAVLQQHAIDYASSEYAKRSSKALDYGQAVSGGEDIPTIVPSTYADVYGDQSANLNALAGFREMIYQNQDQQKIESQHTSLVGQDRALRGAKDLADAQKEEDRKRLQSYQQQLADMKSLQTVDAGDEYTFWTSKTNAFKAGSEAYLEVTRNAGAAYQEVVKANRAAIAEAAKVPGGFDPQVFGMDGKQIVPNRVRMPLPDPMSDEENKRYVSADASAATANLRTLNESAEAQEKQAFALREVQLQTDAAGGTLSRYNAVLQANQLHADEYAAALDRLRERLAAVQANTMGLSPNQQAQEENSIQKQISELNGSRAIQEVQDNAALDSTTLSGSFRDTLNQFVQQSQDTGAQIKEIFTQSLSSVNGSLSQSLTAYAHTNRQYWRQVRQGLSGSVRGIGSSILNTGMQKAEGAALGALGFGSKPDGSAGNPLWVRIANTLGIGGGGASSTVQALNTGGGSFWGTLARSLGGSSGGSAAAAGSVPGAVDTSTAFGTGFTDPFQGFFASGGDVLADRPAMVGERGPEMFVPKSSGTIIPNSSLDMGDTHHHWNIDARGSSNPAETHAAVMRGIREALPQIIGASNAARTERNLRMPSSMRV